MTVDNFIAISDKASMPIYSREQWYPCGATPQIISWEWLQCVTCAYCFGSKLCPRTDTDAPFRVAFLDSKNPL